MLPCERLGLFQRLVIVVNAANGRLQSAVRDLGARAVLLPAEHALRGPASAQRHHCRCGRRGRERCRVGVPDRFQGERSGAACADLGAEIVIARLSPRGNVHGALHLESS